MGYQRKRPGRIFQLVALWHLLYLPLLRQPCSIPSSFLNPWTVHHYASPGIVDSNKGDGGVLQHFIWLQCCLLLAFQGTGKFVLNLRSILQESREVCSSNLGNPVRRQT